MRTVMLPNIAAHDLISSRMYSYNNCMWISESLTIIHSYELIHVSINKNKSQ